MVPKQDMCPSKTFLRDFAILPCYKLSLTFGVNRPLDEQFVMVFPRVFAGAGDKTDVNVAFLGNSSPAVGKEITIET